MFDLHCAHTAVYMQSLIYLFFFLIFICWRGKVSFNLDLKLQDLVIYKLESDLETWSCDINNKIAH